VRGGCGGVGGGCDGVGSLLPVLRGGEGMEWGDEDIGRIGQPPAANTETLA
jgi:hypothetical protein